MNKFVFDTSVISTLRHYHPDTFPALWENLQSDVDNGAIASVKEARRELKRWEGCDFIDDWVKRNVRIFTPPSAQEQQFVRWLLTEDRGRLLVKKKSIKAGAPEADLWIIAKARYVRGATVVTMEKRTAPRHNPSPKQGKIPDVCDGLEIPCINLEEFMRNRGWRF